MTGAQASYLQTLAEEAHESVELDLNKTEASKKIDRLAGAVSPRGQETPPVDANNAMVKRDGRHRAAAVGPSVPKKLIR
jgi:hypothetical protein